MKLCLGRITSVGKTLCGYQKDALSAERKFQFHEQTAIRGIRGSHTAALHPNNAPSDRETATRASRTTIFFGMFSIKRQKAFLKIGLRYPRPIVSHLNKAGSFG